MVPESSNLRNSSIRRNPNSCVNRQSKILNPKFNILFRSLETNYLIATVFARLYLLTSNNSQGNFMFLQIRILRNILLYCQKCLYASFLTIEKPQRLDKRQYWFTFDWTAWSTKCLLPSYPLCLANCMHGTFRGYVLNSLNTDREISTSSSMEV